MRLKRRKMTEEDYGLPGANAQVKTMMENKNSYPSGNQYADNPIAYPPFHRSPDHTPSKETRMQEITGWGVDLSLDQRPAVPKERMPAREIGVHWDQPDPQIPNVQIFHSIERPGITPVFGTSCPPRGLSGWIRKMAYRLSENNIFRWLSLILADRVDMVEGVILDVKEGHLPNFFKERGFKSEWKYNKRGVVRRIAVAGLVIGALTIAFRRRRARTY